MLEPITNSVSSEQFAATARATQDVGQISGRVYRARNASLARPTVGPGNTDRRRDYCPHACATGRIGSGP